ncbi:CocE/NonD family hydrolase [Actinophytocola algeriensis]|uniref:Xaa-Pro dipeptidyl-peptidase n=1 Tax=Actinophytocola algeriensis TaxID=1768010 RepID=A0A7W7VIJ7_9PSEU|nr:CocE/NonD family hydrolase [Actinophytocola algeriensis]MBB4911611.1 X-Pro dipeptidyl-peptidase [Actinophytocola algeriensis]MBE1473401.1 X-Pro dipeptidyl-peptidase [Actinophytocola algeriensis]
MVRRGGIIAGLVVVLSGLVAVPASAATPAFVVANGVTQPIHAFADAVRETVWVDIGLDLDGDGVGDRVATDLIRPATTEPVPVIIDASPYYTTSGRGNESERKSYDSAGLPLKFPLFYDNYFVPRGYAVALVDFSGSSRSTGCMDTGGRSEVASGKAVVDWLNGRATGYSAASGGSPVTASWSTGAAAMIGKSWDGSITQGVAATGVDGLRPIAAISSWYDWFRSDGVSFRSFGTPTSLASGFENANARSRCAAVRSEMTAGAPGNGDYTAMWQQRDYVRNAANVRAAVFSVNGRADLNVKAVNWGQWLDAVPASVPRKLWLSQTGHIDPFDFRRATWVATLHRWFDRWLLDVPNGIENEPKVSVERAVDQWSDTADWPPAGTRSRTLYPVAGSVAGVGTLRTTPGTSTSSFTDNGSGTPSRYIASPGATSARRVVYSTGTLATDLRVAGVSRVTVAATPSTSTAHLSAYLVDYGPATARGSSGEGIRTLATESCWGENRPGDDACYRDTVATTAAVDAQVIARGWADLANYASLSTPRTLTPGTRYTMTFRLSTTDWTVPAGHRLALVIAGNDSSMTTTPGQLPRVTIGLAETSVRIPLLGTVPAARSGPAPEVVRIQPDPVPGRLDG